MKKHWRTIAILVLVAAAIIVGGMIWNNANTSSQASSLQTAVVERGLLAASIGATGSIQAKQQAVMSYSVSGHVGKVNVRMGDRVEAGDILVELDPAYYPQSVLAAQIDLINAQKALEDLQKSQTTLAQAGLNLANAKKALDNAQTEYNNTVQRYNDGWVKECQDKVETAYQNWLIYRWSNTGDRAAQTELARLYQVYWDALREYQLALEYYKAGVGGMAAGTKEAQMALDIAKANLDLAQAQYDDAQAEYNRLKDGVPSGDLAAAQARVDAAQSTINQVNITAPFSGTILSIDLEPGDIVGPGTAALVIADLSELHVDVPIAEVDYNRLALGQNALLVLDAISGSVYHGTVQEINLNATSSAGSVAYPVKVVITDADGKILPGMTVAVDIEVEHLENVLLVPNRAVRTINGGRVVYVSVNGVLKAVEIELGANNDTMSEVVSGDLKEGDVVVLNPPSTFFNGSGGSSGGPMNGGGGGGGMFGGG
jgi:HlyD family secretion protein